MEYVQTYDTPIRKSLRVALVEQKRLSLPERMSSPEAFSGVRVVWSLVFCVGFCRSSCVLLFFFWPLYCQSFFDLWLPLRYFANSFYHIRLPISGANVFYFDCWCFVGFLIFCFLALYHGNCNNWIIPWTLLSYTSPTKHKYLS